MRGRVVAKHAGVGLVSTVPVAAIAFAAQAWAGLPNPVEIMFEATSRVLPGRLVSFGIDRVVDLVTAAGARSTSVAAKRAEVALACLLALGAGATLGALVGATSARLGRRAFLGGAAVGALAGAALTGMQASLGFPASGAAASTLWLVGLLVCWGAALGLAVQPGPPTAIDRRGLLATLGSAALAMGAAVVIGGRRRVAVARRGRRAHGRLPATSGSAASPPDDVLAARAPAVPHTRAELTDNASFYRIDIDLRPPSVDGRAWRLAVGGLVDRPLSLTIDDVLSRPAITQAATLSCISNRIGGDLIGTSLWTGVRLRDLLREAGLRPNVRAIFVEAADGFFETIELPDALDDRTLLVHAMNGEPLAEKHGFPLRVYVPNRYGMKQPKWIVRLTAIDAWRPGYWVERGWSRDAVVKTVSVIDTVETGMMVGQAKSLRVGGIAYAGARGINRVEVQVDDGKWTAAELRTPALGPLTWVQWRFAWPYTPGQHTFRVRAYDGTGRLQPTDVNPPHPSGASGVHTLTTVV